MDTKHTGLKTQGQEVLANDAEYFKYIFKKTEKIVCAVFFILRTDIPKDTKDSVIVRVEESAHVLMDTAYQCLKTPYAFRDSHVNDHAFALIELESRLRMLNAAQYLRTDLLEVFIHEIDSVMRMLRRYRQTEEVNPLLKEEAAGSPLGVLGAVRREREVRQRKEERPVGAPTVAVGLSQNTGRRERIIAVIRDKGEATIKDVSEHITDCSEKTIQRELIDLIKDGLVVRNGERRWSKYSLSA